MIDRPISILLCLFLWCLVGCGSGNTVTGKVTFSDGEPLTVGRVMFTNDSTTAFGDINAKGEYRMGTKKAGDGVPAGTYQVYITSALVPSEKHARQDEDGNTYVPSILAIDPKFTVPSQSELTCEVSGKRTFDISVEKPSASYNPFPTEDAFVPRRADD